MFGGFIRIAEQDIDAAVERVLTNKRVEKLARRITEMMLEQLTEGLKARDQEE